MVHARLIVLLAVAAAWAGMCAPASAVARSGVYAWSLASNFTSASPGANPDHGPYGTTPWTYVDGTTPTFAPLNDFETPSSGEFAGLAGWTDSSDTNAFVGINPSGSPVTPIGGPTFAAHSIVMQAPADKSVAVGWTSPFPQSTTVAVNFKVTAAATASCPLGGPSSTLEQGGQPIAGTSEPDGSTDAFPTVPTGGTVYLTVSAPALEACAAANVSLTVYASGTAPQPTITTPVQNETVVGSQPMFQGVAGAAFGDSTQVTVHLYRGSSAKGTPVQNLTTPEASASYTVTPPAPLADGTYTAQTEQDDLATPPDVGLSAPVTFTVSNGGPTVKLRPVGSKPLLSSSPTITGTAGTAAGDSDVVIAIVPGSTLPGQAIRILSASVDSHGDFSAKVSPALADGEYTADALQSASSGGVGESPPLTFRIKAHPPAITLTSPTAGASVGHFAPTFSGAAGDALGDSSTISVTLYKGSSTKGKQAGTVRVIAKGASWSVTWPSELALGLYTVQASQSDDAGHTARTAARTFLVVPGPSTVGQPLTLSRHGVVSVPVRCLASKGSTCVGTVLVLTEHSFQPTSGGPTGPIKVLFDHVRIPGGKTVVEHGKLSRGATRTLRRKRSVPVRFTTSLGVSGATAVRVSGTRTLRT